MTDKLGTRPDPVAPRLFLALEEALSDADFGKNDGGFDNGRPDRNIRQLVGYLRDRGYVLVNADMLAEALRAMNRGYWPGLTMDGPMSEHIAAAIFAALKGPQP